MAARTHHAHAGLAVLAVLALLAAIGPPTALASGKAEAASPSELAAVDPESAKAAAEARQVSFTALVIEASNPAKPAPPDPRLSHLVPDLKRLFQFTQYKLLGTPAGTARVGQMWQPAALPGGVTLQATPTAIEPTGIQVFVRLLRGADDVVKSTVRVASGGQVLVGGTPSPQGTLIVALKASAL